MKSFLELMKAKRPNLEQSLIYFPKSAKASRRGIQMVKSTVFKQRRGEFLLLKTFYHQKWLRKYSNFSTSRTFAKLSWFVKDGKALLLKEMFWKEPQVRLLPIYFIVVSIMWKLELECNLVIISRKNIWHNCCWRLWWRW